jgi:AcrR family transcriptional regulator
MPDTVGHPATPNTTNTKAVALLDAVERVWCEHGDLGLTVRRLAHEADTTSQSIYTYYGAIAAVIDAAYQRAEHSLTTLTAQATTMTAWADYARGHPAHWWMVVIGHGPYGRVSQQLLDTRQRLQHLAGSPVNWAILNGLIAAEQRGELTPTQLTDTLNQLTTRRSITQSARKS